ncbi:MAG: Maf family protein [Defluviitaleaceae bacterium]|nr:Maf family protein [Defluviitaleaceae bacterium]
MKIILASGSPRRKQLMELAGIPFEVKVSNADETISGAPDFQVRELALRKAEMTLSMLDEGYENAIIIAADTLVYIDGRVLSKPENPDDAFAMLKHLAGQKHTVYTGVALLKTDGTDGNAFVDSTDVYFHPLTDAQIHAYIATGEPFDKAGAYGVQEKGAVLVDRVEGDFYTVVGLPISKVFHALVNMGFNPWA